MEITLYDEIYYENDNINSFYFNMVGMTDSSYLLVYYNTTTKIDDYYGYGPLQAKLATVATATGAITLSDPVVLMDSSPIYTLAVTRIDDDTAVVAYADYALNTAMRVQGINVNADNTVGTNKDNYSLIFLRVSCVKAFSFILQTIKRYICQLLIFR